MKYFWLAFGTTFALVACTGSDGGGGSPGGGAGAGGASTGGEGTDDAGPGGAASDGTSGSSASDGTAGSGDTVGNGGAVENGGAVGSGGTPGSGGEAGTADAAGGADDAGSSGTWTYTITDGTGAHPGKCDGTAGEIVFSKNYLGSSKLLLLQCIPAIPNAQMTISVSPWEGGTITEADLGTATATVNCGYGTVSTVSAGTEVPTSFTFTPTTWNATSGELVATFSATFAATSAHTEFQLEGSMALDVTVY